MVQRLALIDRHYKEAKKHLKQWIDNHGSVATNGVTWGYFGSTGVYIDEGVITDEALKGRLNAYLVLDQGKKSKLWEDTNLLEDLKKVGALRPVSSSKFSQKKASAEEEANAEVV